MKAVKLILAGGVAVAALASAAPAAAQYYPTPGYGYPGNVVGNVINQVLGGGYGYNGYNGYNYGMNSQAAVDRCAAAVTQRINGQYGGYAPYGGYGYNQPYAASARVVGITSVERRSNNKLRVRGVATSGTYGGYGYNGQPNISFKCNIDYRGYISDIDLDRYASNYGYSPYGGTYGTTPYGSYYNYRRY